MGRLVVSEFMSLDGVVEDPAGDWAGQFDQGPEAGEFKLFETMNSECQLYGRVTYEEFARSWPGEQGEFADKFNSLPKYVVSSTLRNPQWGNTTVLGGDLADQVSELKAAATGDIVVHGSATLVHALLDHGLVDELRLIVFPIVLGGGRKLFKTGAPVKLKLASATPVGPDGVLLLVYER
ncbi:dihydrofolate reductase family protein [Actinocrispum wychmicini]|uniref:Dihydrofolate reductase n=1 Tax=Actinocrispum wychmicini TaxID=1213861 RepID=A0A4V6NNN2_9PSEU|nr:dihydrofolate reductase family protein [Actinocrispum wychmicini]TCO49720.1 dihydrofolate reductase [Actinocrispum wychmicini]